MEIDSHWLCSSSVCRHRFQTTRSVRKAAEEFPYIDPRREGHQFHSCHKPQESIGFSRCGILRSYYQRLQHIRLFRPTTDYNFVRRIPVRGK
jgi:hypothetical protein